MIDFNQMKVYNNSVKISTTLHCGLDFGGNMTVGQYL